MPRTHSVASNAPPCSRLSAYGCSYRRKIKERRAAAAETKAAARPAPRLRPSKTAQSPRGAHGTSDRDARQCYSRRRSAALSRPGTGSAVCDVRPAVRPNPSTLSVRAPPASLCGAHRPYTGAVVPILPAARPFAYSSIGRQGHWPMNASPSSPEVLRFLNAIEAQVPARKTVH